MASFLPLFLSPFKDQPGDEPPSGDGGQKEDPDVGVGVGISIPNGDGSFTLSAKDLMNLLMASKAPAMVSATVSNPTSPSPPAPRVGGVNRLGAWTGLGALDEGQDPRSPNCMRAFQADPLKEHQALKPVIKACIKGITEDNVQFCLNNETNADRICLCIRNIEEHFPRTRHGTHLHHPPEAR